MAGEVSLAHYGVLFPDELPEFHHHVFEVLRQPLADGMVTITRALISVTFSARLMLVRAVNPCPYSQPGYPEKHYATMPEVCRRRGEGDYQAPQVIPSE
jgi:magnesium chelatase family protein